MRRSDQRRRHCRMSSPKNEKLVTRPAGMGFLFLSQRATVLPVGRRSQLELSYLQFTIDRVAVQDAPEYLCILLVFYRIMEGFRQTLIENDLLGQDNDRRNREYNDHGDELTSMHTDCVLVCFRLVGL